VGGEYTLRALSVPESLSQLHELLEDVASEHPSVMPEDLLLFETAVVEIAGNVVKHGRPPGEVVWRFRLRVLEDRLEGILTDSGEHYAHDLEALMPGILEESGRGLPLARAAVDTLTYERADGINRWNLVRSLRGSRSQV